MFRPTSVFDDLLTNASSNMSNVEPADYEDTHLKKLATDMNQSQDAIVSAIEQFAVETRRIERSNTILSVVAIIISVCTLIASIISIFV